MRHLMLLSLFGLVALALLVPATPLTAQSNTEPRLVFQATVPNVREIKFPDVVGAGEEVFISANANRADAFVWQKPDRATTFPEPTRLGSAPGQADFSTTSVAVGPDGAVHYIWINQEERRIYYRRKPLNGPWGPQRVAYAGARGAFPVNAVVEVSTDNFAYIAWREPDTPAYVIRSNDDGQNWSPRIAIGDRPAYNFPALAPGPNGSMGVAVTIGESDLLTVQAGFWDGRGFSLVRLTPFEGDGFADPTITYNPEGGWFVAYRGIAEGGPTSGIWVSNLQGDTWVRTRITGPSANFGTANIFSDSRGNLHLQWNARIDLGQRVYYSVRPRGRASFTQPISAPNDAGVIFNSRGSATVSDAAYAHIVGEIFGGGPSELRYLLFSGAPGAPNIGAAPKIKDDAPFTARGTNITVSFVNVRGQPSQIRWRWNAEPTDAANDSNGWQSFTNPMTIPLPERLFVQPCTPVRLFTQVRGANGDLGPVESDDIVLDAGIQASVTISNPYIGRRAPIFTPAGEIVLSDVMPADVGTSGASDGHPNYIREPLYYLDIRSAGDCSRLKDVAVGRTATSFARAIPIQNEIFANVLGYPGRINPGENNLVVRVSDGAGNLQDYPQRLIYDPLKPILTGAPQDALQIRSNPNATILASLNFRDIAVADNAYPGRGFWGVWLANSRQPSSNPTTDPSLVWFPVAAPGDSSTFTIPNWSLASGLPANQVTPGAYYVYARFLDGAGNPTDGYVQATVNLETVTFVRTYLPFVRR